ncbi:MAG: D-3-phosphoglycerate dehydrogenase / 2-oxoglutarate reductase [Clostridiales bacterium]|nr:D-3-phosphoglycerate dehydrogenase / 2-oxoglutarate reductase [Clostridiales bacterium]MDN5299151.1 D-3-phosphoglycerate dehydrogenase / 2-oxoglutarate reductase [Clostridiales bacterium]
MSKYKIIITDCEYAHIENECRILNPIADVMLLQSKDAAEIIKHSADCDALIFQYAKITETVILHLSKCKVIAKYATSIDGIDLNACAKKGIIVTNVSDYCTEEVATHLVAFLLMIAKQTKHYMNKVKSGQWYYSKDQPMPPLSHSTIGIIGFGKITRKALSYLTPFSKKLMVYSEFASAETIAAHGAAKQDLSTLLANSDYVIVLTPLTPQSKHLLKKESFISMKKSAYLINVSRGQLIDETALVWALQTGEIAGAALDVVTEEPIDRHHPLHAFDNVILTPHVAWYSVQSIENLQKTVAEDVRRVLLGLQPENIVSIR